MGGNANERAIRVNPRESAKPDIHRRRKVGYGDTWTEGKGLGRVDARSTREPAGAAPEGDDGSEEAPALSVDKDDARRVGRDGAREEPVPSAKEAAVRCEALAPADGHADPRREGAGSGGEGPEVEREAAESSPDDMGLCMEGPRVSLDKADPPRDKPDGRREGRGPPRDKRDGGRDAPDGDAKARDPCAGRLPPHARHLRLRVRRPAPPSKGPRPCSRHEGHPTRGAPPCGRHPGHPECSPEPCAGDPGHPTKEPEGRVQDRPSRRRRRAPLRRHRGHPRRHPPAPVEEPPVETEGPAYPAGHAEHPAKEPVSRGRQGADGRRATFFRNRHRGMSAFAGSRGLTVREPREQPDAVSGLAWLRPYERREDRHEQHQ